MTSYNRMTPVKLSQIYELKEKDQSTWQMLDDGSFSVNKSDIALRVLVPIMEFGKKTEAYKF